MSDHEVTSLLVRDACFAASAPNYVTQQWDPAPPTERIPYVYYVDPVDGMDWYAHQQPVHYLVDITSTFDIKRQMLACHESQRNWLRRQHGIDEYMDMQQRWSSHRGRQLGLGATYAEGLTQHKGHPFPGDNVLATLISGVKTI
jgi:LmbE family N-acetylglucosaminyl deacetylase